jgi:uncharacterized membrane protein
MSKEKVTITLDRECVDAVRSLTGAASTSAAIDLALRELIRAERLRRDVLAYTAVPPTDEEIALSRSTTQGWNDLIDDTDWEALYPEDHGIAP